MKEEVVTSDAPDAKGLLSQAVIANGFIFTSGQVNVKPGNELVGETVAEQTHQVMKNLQAILIAAGAGLVDVVKATLYVTDISLGKEINEVYVTYFDKDTVLPAREMVSVKELPLGATLEISVIAKKP